MAFVTNKGRFVLPVIQDSTLLSLEPISVQIPKSEAVLTVRISSDLELAYKAAEYLLGLSGPEVEAEPGAPAASDIYTKSLLS